MKGIERNGFVKMKNHCPNAVVYISWTYFCILVILKYLHFFSGATAGLNEIKEDSDDEDDGGKQHFPL